MKKISIFLLCIFLQSLPILAEKDEIPNLIKLLGSNDYRINAKARQNLKNFGSLAVPALIQVLNDTKSNDNLRINSIITLENIALDAKEAVPILIETTEDDNFLIRKASVFALGSIDPTNERVISALINALHDRNESVSTYALLSLQNCGSKAVPALVRLLKHTDFNIKVKASIALHNNLQYQDQVVPTLIKALSYNNNELRSLSGVALAEIGPSIVPELSKALNQDNDIIPLGVILTLSFMYKENKPIKSAIPILIRLLNVKDKKVIVQSADLLKQIGPEAKPAAVALIGVLGHDDEEIRFAGMDALIEIGPSSIPELILAVDDGNVNKRIYAISVLAEFDNLPVLTIPPLINALNDTNHMIRIAAIYALGNVCDPNDDVRVALIKAIGDKNEEVSTLAKKTIRKIRAKEDLPVQCD